MDKPHDTVLMLKVKAGDLDTMSLLFERHHRPLLHFFFYLTKEKEVSEDLVQNVFFRMLKYRHSFAGTGSFQTWMYHIARNVLKDHYKKHKRTAAHPAGDEELAIDPGSAPDNLERKQELEILYRALDQLSDENRELLILCRLQQLRYREIAEIFQITEGAVKVRVHRALNELRAVFFKDRQIK